MSQPTRARYLVLALTTSMAVLLYLDRICISKAGKHITAELQLTDQEMGTVYGAFFLAYALCQVPAGWLGDRWGARRTLVVFVVSWSVLTALTGLAVGFLSLLLVRLLIGAAQAGAYPIAARVNSLWMPFGERGLSSSIITLGGRSGGAIAPYLTAVLIAAWGAWQPVFAAYCIPGLLWAVVFWLWYRDSPAEHPACNAAEQALISHQPVEATSPQGKAGAIPWKAVLCSRSLWLQCFAQLTTNISWIFLITWLPTYLESRYGLSDRETGLLSSLPLMAGAAGCLLGGAATDWLTRRIGLKWGRNLLGMGTKFLAAGALLNVLGADSAILAVVAFSASAFMFDLGLGATWAYFQDAGGNYVGTLLGWANMFGNLGAFVSPILLIWLRDQWGWPTALTACVVLYVISGLCWLGIDARVPIVRTTHK